MGGDISASLNTSHTAVTTLNQQGAAINTGISFSPQPVPTDLSMVNNPGVPPLLSQFTPAQLVTGGIVFLVFVLALVKIFRG
ncbi:MAG: hypothetical protein ACREL1_00365 [bacterium]